MSARSVLHYEIVTPLGVTVETFFSIGSAILYCSKHGLPSDCIVPIFSDDFMGMINSMKG